MKPMLLESMLTQIDFYKTKSNRTRTWSRKTQFDSLSIKSMRVHVGPELGKSDVFQVTSQVKSSQVKLNLVKSQY